MGAFVEFDALELPPAYHPTNGTPTTHIVKVPIYRSGVKESVYNEYYCMRLARLVGINVPHCSVLDHEEHPLYIISRYDRSNEKKTKRIYQQDFCQAQAGVSENKYEAKDQRPYLIVLV
jgi:serine/threonine-protein kinase HipA